MLLLIVHQLKINIIFVIINLVIVFVSIDRMTQIGLSMLVVSLTIDVKIYSAL